MRPAVKRNAEVAGYRELALACRPSPSAATSYWQGRMSKIPWLWDCCAPSARRPSEC